MTTLWRHAMSRLAIMTLVLGAALAAAPYAIAHEGHAHKMMGTVATVNDHRLEVKAADGKTAAVTLNEKTKILRGKVSARLQDIKAGERVVVTAMEQKGADGKPEMIASEVRLADAASPPSGQ